MSGGSQGYEMSEREIAAIHNENNGSYYHRLNTIRSSAFDAVCLRAEKIEELCSFKNRHGWCKLKIHHSGNHTVIYLGDDGR